MSEDYSGGNTPGTRINEKLIGFSDAFGELVAKGTRNALDLPAFYDFSTERYRYIENGTRIDTPDADSTRFSDQDEQFLLEPNAGDTLEFKTAEAPRYVVGNDADVSWSFKFGVPLVDASDSFTLFVEDAFELEYTGDGTATLRSLEDGSEKASVNVPTANDLDDPSRPELEFNWYAVGRAEITIEYTENGEQKTTEPATLTVDDDWLSDDPTGRVGFRLDVTNGGITLEAGSIGYIIKSQTPPTSRPKPHILASSETNTIAADGYTAVAALRIDPERDNVFTSVTDVNITTEASVDTEVYLKAVNPADTDADFVDVRGDGSNAGPAYPRVNTPQNSVLQWTPNVSTFSTRTDAVSGNTIPNGRAIGGATESAAGTGAGTTKTSRGFTQKRPIYPDDVVVIIGHTPDASTATDVDIQFGTEQDW